MRVLLPEEKSRSGRPSLGDARGFTLLELLIVLFLTSLLLYSIYQLFDKSTRLYKVQDDMVTMQANIRFALEQLRTDVKNAGFQASPNTLSDSAVCPKPPSIHRAIRLEHNPIFSGKFDNKNPYVIPVSIYLWGDIRIGQSFFTEYVTGNTVKIKGDFTDEEFARIFTIDSFLRLVNHDQYEMVYKITSVSASARTVTLDGNPPIVSDLQPCGVDGLGENQLANVIDYVRYRIIFDPADTTNKRTLLVREYLKQDGTTVRDRGVTVIADNVVDLQVYDFVFDSDLTRKLPVLDRSKSKLEDVLDDGDDGILGKDNGSSGDPAPENLRFFTLVLTVRSDSHDFSLSHEPKKVQHAPLVSFTTLPKLQGASRVLTVASKMELRSLSVRNLKSGLP
ncbi:MAG: prepilin-type N-terminal cleavage/methylation domain-containing protein [Myxococcales bacterium]|nr:prepilin-type N-terminal cleavage/methylation domain-containing protein [Myxococcales bacterium]